MSRKQAANKARNQPCLKRKLVGEARLVSYRDICKLRKPPGWETGDEASPFPLTIQHGFYPIVVIVNLRTVLISTQLLKNAVTRKSPTSLIGISRVGCALYTIPSTNVRDYGEQRDLLSPCPSHRGSIAVFSAVSYSPSSLALQNLAS